jgi:hypothetical protein
MGQQDLVMFAGPPARGSQNVRHAFLWEEAWYTGVYHFTEMMIQFGGVAAGFNNQNSWLGGNVGAAAKGQ